MDMPIFRDFDTMMENVSAVERGPMQPLIIDALKQLRSTYDTCYFPPYPWITSFTQHLLGHYDSKNDMIGKWYRENRTIITTNTVIPIHVHDPIHTFDGYYNLRLKPFLAMAITVEEYEDMESAFVVFARDMLGFCAANMKDSPDCIYIVAKYEDTDDNADHLFMGIPKGTWHLSRSMFPMRVDDLSKDKGGDRYERIDEFLSDPGGNHRYGVDDYIMIDMGKCTPYPDDTNAHHLMVGRDDPDTVMQRIKASKYTKDTCIIPFHWPNL